jgi:hypothetical protein
MAEGVLPTDSLTIDVPGSAVGAAFEAATQRVAAAATRGLSAADAAWCGAAALAMGERGLAERCLSLMATSDPSDARVLALELLLVSACSAWTGDDAYVHGALPRVRDLLASLAGDSVVADAESELYLLAALHEGSAALESVGQAKLVADLRTRAGHSSAVRPIVRFADLISLKVRDVSWTGWIQQLDRSIARESGSDGAAALAILTLVYLVLGIEPDAPRNRLRLAPQVPARSAFSIDNLRVSDGAILCACESDGGHTRIRIEQTAGAIPLRLVLEPVLPARAVVETRIDGRTAKLTVRTQGNYLCVPVQLDLGEERVVEIRQEG